MNSEQRHLLFHAGAFAARPCPADRLATILSDWLGQDLQVEQFAGTWLMLDAGERRALPHAGPVPGFSRLGVDTAIGMRACEIQSRIVLRIGPLGIGAFGALLPGRAEFGRIVARARAYLDREIGFAINVILAADAVAQIELGWNTWLPTSKPRQEDACDAVFSSSADRTVCCEKGSA